MSQDTLFDVGASPVVPPNQAADHYRRLPTCWEYCGHLGMKLYHDRGHVHRLCHVEKTKPMRKLESTVICDFALRRIPEDHPKPQAPGWDDY